ncbi:MAG: hypothetical protein KDE22_09235 [Rhodobacterales bacterium]|nr:hypothetical protein [Rhodobacterales bacterium]
MTAAATGCQVHLPGGGPLIWGDVLKRAGIGRASAVVVAREAGVLSGSAAAEAEAKRLGLDVQVRFEGESVFPGQAVARVSGPPAAVSQARETLVGTLAKPSGIATAALAYVDACGDRPRVVCTAWRDQPPALHGAIRQALKSGGASSFLADGPHIEVEREQVARLGGWAEGLATLSASEGIAVVMEMADHGPDVAADARAAAAAGAAILRLGPAHRGHLGRVAQTLRDAGLRDRVVLAYGGDIGPRDVCLLKAEDLDILDVGAAVADAALLDMAYRVTGYETEREDLPGHG